jgi:DnaJ-class molecular chaperone
MKDWNKAFAQLDAENRAAGRCIKCGGSGVVANMSSSDPHANLRCQRCKGTGKLHPNDAPAAEREPEPEKP